MHRVKEGLFVESTEIEITSKCQSIPHTPGLEGGVICTGFIDVEKILTRVHFDEGLPVKTHFFLEKKLPFQVVFLTFPQFDDDDDLSGESSGESSGTSSGESSGESGDGSFETASSSCGESGSTDGDDLFSGE